LSVSLATLYGDDVYGEFVHRTVGQQEQVDLTPSRQLTDWSTPVTVSMAYQADRSMVTYRESPPIELDDLVSDPPRARHCFIHLDQPPPRWVERLREQGTVIVADVGWDPTGAWAPRLLDRLGAVDMFVPNSVEAMAYTRTASPHDALDVLAERVGTVAVKCGASGALAARADTGERVEIPALPITAVDPTGAGDVFAAAFVAAHRYDWSLRQRVDFANLCAGMSVRHHSGSLGAPCWHDIAEWLTAAPSECRTRFEYLWPSLPDARVADRVRAMPTLRRAPRN
jgi:sugar/nucleoside kinase (ribokinase family)